MKFSLNFFVIAAFFAVGSIAIGQEGADSVAKSVTESGASSRSDESTAGRIQLAIDELGSSEFAERERAAEVLMTIGLTAVPSLRQLSTHQDPEVRLRAADLIQQLTEGDFQKRVKAFLAGKDVEFDGWEYFQSKLGSSPVVRELFIEFSKGYPDVAKALDGTARERAVAQEATVRRIQTGMFIERRWPEPVDAIALLLPAADADVPVAPQFENLLIGILRRDVGTKIRREQQLRAPVTALIGEWVKRSSSYNRGEVLWFSMDWGVPEGFTLARQTLGEQHGTDILSIAMQTIARFGNKDDAKNIAQFLDDTRPASEVGMAIGAQSQTLLGDVAMATIALLYDVPLAEIGWSEVSEHPTFAFSVEELGFPANSPELRVKVRAKIDALMADPVPQS